MSSTEWLHNKDVIDRSVAMGVASQPVGWRSWTELQSFGPSGFTDQISNQIFARRLYLGRGAEAYVRSLDRKVVRLSTHCGDGLTKTRSEHWVRLAVLHEGASSHRLAFLLNSDAPKSLTIACWSREGTPFSFRILMTPDPHGLLNCSGTGVMHEPGWLEALKRRKTTRFPLVKIYRKR